MAARSKEWLQAYEEVDPLDAVQKQMVDLLALPIHYSDEAQIQERARNLIKLVENADLESSIRLDQQLNRRYDPLNRLVNLELSEATADKIRRIAKRNVAIGQRLTAPAHRGVVIVKAPISKPVVVKSSDPKRKDYLPKIKKSTPPKTPGAQIKTNPPTYIPVWPEPMTIEVPALKDENDKTSWLDSDLAKLMSASAILGVLTYQLDLAAGVGMAAISDWLLEEALQVGANEMIKSVGHTPANMTVGNTGERIAYYMLKTVLQKELQAAGLSILDLNTVKSNFPAFDLYAPGVGFMSVKTYGILSKKTSAKLTSYIKSSLKRDFAKLFDQDFVDQAARAFQSQAGSFGMGQDVTSIKSYMLDHFKFCIPEDQRNSALSGFAEYIDTHRQHFPELAQISTTDATTYTDKVYEIARRYIYTHPVHTKTLRTLYEILNHADEIKAILSKRSGGRIDWIKNLFKDL